VSLFGFVYTSDGSMIRRASLEDLVNALDVNMSQFSDKDGTRIRVDQETFMGVQRANNVRRCRKLS